MFSKIPMKHFKGVSSRFTELHAKLDANTLLDFAIHRRQNKTRSRKSTRKNSACSQYGVTWQTDATGFQKCDLGLPYNYVLHLLVHIILLSCRSTQVRLLQYIIY
jgi:hypothetical protein